MNRADFFVLWGIGATAVMTARAGRLNAGTAAAILFGLYFLFGGALVALRAALA